MGKAFINFILSNRDNEFFFNFFTSILSSNSFSNQIDLLIMTKIVKFNSTTSVIFNGLFLLTVSVSFSYL